MRIALHHFSLRLWPYLVAPPLTPSNEELLLRSEAVQGRSRMLLFRLPERPIRDLRARQVADALAETQPAVVVDVWLNEISIKLAHYAGCLFLESLLIVGGPPVVETALSIELRPLIVKAMADLVPDHDSYGAIVDGVCGIHVESRRLKNARRKDDFVHQRVVVSVRGRRRHAPAAAV